MNIYRKGRFIGGRWVEGSFLGMGTGPGLMNEANAASAARFPLFYLGVQVIEGTWESSWLWFVLGLLILGALSGGSDYLDGWIAKKRGQESEFGRLFDPFNDGIVMLAAAWWLYNWRDVPDVLLLVAAGGQALIIIGAAIVSVTTSERGVEWIGKAGLVARVIGLLLALIADRIFSPNTSGWRETILDSMNAVALLLIAFGIIMSLYGLYKMAVRDEGSYESSLDA